MISNQKAWRPENEDQKKMETIFQMPKNPPLYFRILYLPKHSEVKIQEF